MCTFEIAIQSPFSKPYRRPMEGKVFGAWAAHEAVNELGYRVTFLRFGLAAPYFFETMAGAAAAAKKINALCSDWDDLTGKEIKSRRAKAIKAICAKYPGMVSDGPKGRAVPVTKLREAA